MLYGELPDRLRRSPGREEFRYKGNLNGVPVRIPVSYVWFPMEYCDISIWAPSPDDKPREARAYEDAICAFASYVRWPQMQPRSASPELMRKFWLEREGLGEHPWIMIGVDAGNYIRSPRPPQAPDNGFARVLRWRLENLPESSSRYGGDAHYELRGVDTATGLHWAEPVGEGVQKYDTWNKVLYWRGDMNGVVTDLFICQNGAFINPKITHDCTYEFYLHEIRTKISVTFPRRWLPQWREIREATTRMLMQFVVKGAPSRETVSDDQEER
ncbi:MAG TPA: hypothetical protein EYP40_11140 [Chromatiales bacterium]|nr:hypothetical protein [Chromatiales bacterium]